jgi:hypothetical protein
MAFALVFSIASYAMAKPSSRPQLRATVERQAVRTQPMQRVNSGGPNRSWNNNREVLNRDARINQRINNNYGHLNGQYWNLEKQDQHIYNQDQRDLRANGGQLTGQEYRQLNREENALSQETRLDNTNNPFTQNHPRRAEVLARDARLNYGINSDEGHLGGHYNQLMGEDRSIARQEQTDASINGGFITKGQQGQLNREENALAQQVRYDNTNNPFVQNHPRRSEVLGRDSSLNYQINKDEGALNGQYGQLMSEDKSIRSQEQADARANGGYITTAQQQQLNQEENQLRQQIIQDHQ